MYGGKRATRSEFDNACTLYIHFITVSSLSLRTQYNSTQTQQYSRYSRGTAAKGCCCTVIDVGTTVLPAESHPALATLIPTCTVHGETPVQKLQLSRTDFRPHNLLFYNTNLSTSNPCNSTELTLHVLTNCQHVSLIMLAKFNHVATVVAASICSSKRCHC